MKKENIFPNAKVTYTGATGLIKNEYYKQFNADIFGWWPPMADFVSVYEDEIVSVLDDTSEGYVYIRNSKGEVGWFPNDSVDISESE